MSHIDILIPFSLPPAEMAPDLLRSMQTPAFATLLARARMPKPHEFDAFSRALPHEVWLAQQFGLNPDASSSARFNNSPPLANTAMQSFDLTPDAGYWFVLQPVHIHVARDHLVLTDPRRLELSEQEARALFDTVQPLFAEVGKTLLYGDAHTWFVRADDWAELRTSTPDAACGHNIDIWLPEDPHGIHGRAWRKLQNEVQMHWHVHPVNEERAARRVEAVNSLWLWGGAAATQASTPHAYTHLFNLTGLIQPYRQSNTPHQQNCKMNDIIAAAPACGLLLLDALTGAGLAQDWSYWLEQMHALETDWFAPLLAALRDGQISSATLHLTHHAKLTELTITRNSLRKFWVKPTLARLR